MYKFIPLFALLSRILRRKVGDFIVKAIGVIAWLFCPRMRNVVIKNLSYITDKEVKKKSFKVIINYFTVLKDFFDVWWRKPEDIIKDVETHGEENLWRAVKENNGAVIVTYHMGNYELSAIYLTLRGFPITSVVEKVSSPVHYTMYNKLRTKFGTELISTAETARIVNAVKRKRVLALIADRDITGTGIVVNFFKGKRKFPIGPAYLSLRFNIPVITGYFVLGGKKRYIGFIDKKIEFKPSGNFKKDVKRLTLLIEKKMNGYLEKFPEQWFVFQDEWMN